MAGFPDHYFFNDVKHFSPRRDSKTFNPHRWLNSTSFEAVSSMQDLAACRAALDLWGYRRYRSEEEARRGAARDPTLPLRWEEEEKEKEEGQ